MGKKKNKTRAEPKTRQQAKNSVAWLCSPDAYGILTCDGYTPLSQNPEVIAGVDAVARLIGSMTIYLMENTDQGDVRIRNELSRKIDIEPNSHMTRAAFVQWIVRTLYLEGDGNAIVYPYLRRGYLEDLRPVPPGSVSLIPEGTWDYKVNIYGTDYSPDDVLHFKLTPDVNYPWKGSGIRKPLKSVVDNLKQAAATEKGFMSSQWKPSLIVKIDAMAEDVFATKEGRRKLLAEYIETSQAGEPWVLPQGQISVEQVKPLSLSDLALSDMVQLDKKTVAAMIGVPAFALGVGSYSDAEWNNFINAKIMPLAQMIEQELTRKLLLNPAWYFHFNSRSLYSYSLKDLAEIADNQYVRGIMTRDEVRDWIGMGPVQNPDDLIILENFIPAGMIGDQSKLMQNGGGNGGTSGD